MSDLADPIGKELPIGWRRTTLGLLCDENDGEVQTGPFGSQLHAGDYVLDGVPSVMPKDIHGDRISSESVARVSEADVSRLSVHRLRAGDVVYARRGDIGRRALVTDTEEGWLCGTGCLRIRLNAPEVDPRYLLAYLGHPRVKAWVESKAQGATMLNLNTSILRALPLRIPPLQEQRRIADILDKADAIRRKRKEAIALTEELLRSAFLERFGDPVANPKGWAVKPLGEVAEIGTGGTPSRTDSSYFGGSVPWVKTGEVDWRVIQQTEEHITERAVQDTNCKIFPEGTLLVAMYGQGATRGKCALLGIPAATNQACAAILPNPQWNSEFLFWQIRLSYERLRELARGGNQENLNLALVRSLPVIIPPIQKQIQYAKASRAIAGLRDAHARSLVESEQLFQSLVNLAFSGQATAKVAVC